MPFAAMLSSANVGECGVAPVFALRTELQMNEDDVLALALMYEKIIKVMACAHGGVVGALALQRGHVSCLRCAGAQVSLVRTHPAPARETGQCLLFNTS